MPPPSFGISRFTAFILGLVVFVCIGGIGSASYIKYQLDRSETTLAAPDVALGDDQDLFAQLRRTWGFSGFLGYAQKYVFTHDTTGFAEIKDKIKAADEIVAKLPESVPLQTRRELSSIAALFDDALQKMNSPSGGELSNEFTAMELGPLYAALSVLDSRMTSDSAQARFEAQGQARFWATLLTLVSWGSLIIAAACAAGIYLVLRDKQSAPMRALAQSIQNMARGDMRTSIWGTERQDMIGDLARAVDLARYHFSHLPDLSLLSDEGPVRLRFEGGTRTLFEAMMKSISDDSENIRQQSSNLTSAVKQQKDSVSELSTKVETILQSILQRGHNGDKQIAQALQSMVGGAENLKNAHAHTADQLTRLVPIIEERAQKLSEITQITGKQLTHTLQSLVASEMSLKTHTEKSGEILTKLSSTADDLGERLFGAINLLQASGKVLGETTENIKIQWNNMSPAADWSQRLDEIKQQLGSLSEKIESQTSMQLDLIAEGLKQNAASLNASESLSQLGIKLDELKQNASASGTQDILVQLAGKIEEMKGHLEALQSKLDQQASAAQTAAAQSNISAVGDKLKELTEMEGRVAVFVSALPGDLRAALREELEKRSEQDNASAAAQKEVVAKLAEIETGLAATQHAAEAAHAAASRPLVPPTLSMPPEIQQQFLDQWFQMSAQIEASRASMVEAIAGKINELEGRIAVERAKPLPKTTADYALQVQIDKQTEILGELVNTLSLLDAHMQQAKADMYRT
ncbi:MAG: hypothetical protein WC464_03090 [Bdellovibrionales bacterium]